MGSWGCSGKIGWCEFGKAYSDSLVWEVSCEKPRQVCAREESSKFASEASKMEGCRRVPQEVDLRCTVTQMRLDRKSVV